MTIRFSTGLRNALAQGYGFGGIMNRGYMKIWTGSQPATPDAVETGTLCGTITLSSGTLTKETRATGTIALSGTLSGSITIVTVGTVNIIPDLAGAGVPYNTSLIQTASDLADAINRNGYYSASNSGTATVTISPRPGTGTLHNSYVVAVTATGMTATPGNMSAGGVAPVNALILASPSAGVVSKPSAAVWSMSGLGTYTAGWFRYYGSNDPEGATSTVLYPRMDGTCGVGSGDAQLSSLAVSSGSPHTIDVFSFTVPAA